jgi:hypothetical protein
LFDSLKIPLGKWSLNRQLKTFQRERAWPNISEINSVLLLSNIVDDPMGESTKRLHRYFSENNKLVKTLFYTEKVDPENISLQIDSKIFSKKDLNFFMRPDDPAILDIMNSSFDLLVDLSLSEHFPLVYAHATSKAKLRVGASKDFLLTHCDLSIAMKEKENLDQLISQIKHYLQQLNQKQHVASL